MSKKPYLFLATATIIALTSCGGSDSPGGIPEIPTAEKNANANNPKTSRKEVTRLEFPHLKGNGSIVLVHKTNDSYDPDGVNYAVEWDTSLKAQRWTCYQMHKGYRKGWLLRHIHGRSRPAQLRPLRQYECHVHRIGIHPRAHLSIGRPTIFAHRQHTNLLLHQHATPIL